MPPRFGGKSPCAIDAGSAQIIDAKSIATIRWRACFINDANSFVLPQPGRVARRRSTSLTPPHIAAVQMKVTSQRIQRGDQCGRVVDEHIGNRRHNVPVRFQLSHLLDVLAHKRGTVCEAVPAFWAIAERVAGCDLPRCLVQRLNKSVASDDSIERGTIAQQSRRWILSEMAYVQAYRVAREA